MADENVFNTSIRRGDCWSLVVTWLPGGEDVDLTDYSAEFSVYWPRQTVGNGSIPAGEVEVTPVIDIGDGTISAHMEAADTLDIRPVSVASYQMRVTDGDGHKTTIAVGAVTVQSSYLDA